MYHFYDVHGTDCASFWTHGIEVGNHFLFVRDGDVESAQLRIRRHDLRQLFDVGYFEVDILGIDVLVAELLIEKSYRERMP